jgi:hypothetical protein
MSSLMRHVYAWHAVVEPMQGCAISLHGVWIGITAGSGRCTCIIADLLSPDYPPTVNAVFEIRHWGKGSTGAGSQLSYA